MNAHVPPEIVLHITSYDSITIIDPNLPGRKEILGSGTFDAWLVSLARENREPVEWFIFPEHGSKGLTAQAFREYWKRGLIDVEQKTADGWEDYFNDER